MKKIPKYSLYCFPIFVWAIAYFCFSFDGLYGQDAYEYLRYTEALKTFLTSGKPPGDYFWGVYYPIFGSVLSFIIPNIALVLQLISVFSLVITSVFVDKIIRLIYKGNALDNIPFLFFTLSPILLIHSVLVMSDLLACCCITIAVYYLLLFLEIAKNKHFLIGITFCVFAVLTRYAAAVVLLPICIPALFNLLKNRNYKLILFSFPIIGFITIPHIFIRSQNSLQFLSHQWLLTWDIFNLFRSDFVTVDGEMHHHFINLIYVCFQFLHPVFLFIGVFLFVISLKTPAFQWNKPQKILLFSMLLYSLFLGGIPFQNKRFLILSFPLVIVFLFPIIKKLLAVFNYRKLVFMSLAIIQISLAFYFGKTFYERNLLEKTISQEMKQYEGKTLYVFDIDIAMQGRKVVFDYRSLWKTKYPDFEKNALILVNEKQLNKQWKDKNPMMNWEHITTYYKIQKLKNFSGDFNLYRIEGKK